MALIGQQVWGVTLAVALMGCEGAPARSKPWRHAHSDASPELSEAIRDLAVEARNAAASRRNRRELVVSVGADPGALDPLRMPSATALWLSTGTVFEALVRPTDGGVEPLLAERVTRSPDGLVLDFALREVSFHDGRPLAASDVKFSIDSARRGHGHLVRDLADITAVEAVGERGVRVRLRRANRYVERALAEVGIASRVSYYKVRGRGGNRHAAGTGPYAIAAGGKRDRMRLVRFADYWGERKARAPAIEIRVDPDRSKAVALTQLGDVDVAIGADPDLELDDSIAQVVSIAPAQFRYLAFNGRRDLFADAEVRRAVSLAVDRERLVIDGHHRGAEAISAPAWPGGPLSAPAAAIGRTDIRAATSLLDAAGWVKKAGGVRERDNQKLLAVVVTGEGVDVARDLVLDQMRAAGFVLDVRGLDAATLEQALARGDFDAAVLEWRGYPDWDLSPLLASGGADNVGRIASPEIDAALAALREAPGRAARERIAPRLIRALEQRVPAVFLTRSRPRAVLGARVVGYRPGASIALVDLARREPE